jgi:two-component system sensor histidine kinase CpxA
MLWVLPFVSILCCTVGAYVSWRMRKIEAVIQLFGPGQLNVRMPSESKDAIGRLAAAFNQMAERIESLVAAHQRLCADIAHELRSPLTRLLLAIPRARGGDRGAIDRIELEAYGINNLVDELLQVARAETDPETLQIEPVDLDWLLAEIADDCAIEAVDRGCEIQITLACYGKVMGDAELLRRAFENVLRNAVRYTPTGSPVLLNGMESEGQTMIKIRDFGPGVPEHALGEIFKPFYRVESGRDRASGGVGLGLSIAQRAIALHKGTICAENCAPGLCVTIRLPRE